MKNPEADLARNIEKKGQAQIVYCAGAGQRRTWTAEDSEPKQSAPYRYRLSRSLCTHEKYSATEFIGLGKALKTLVLPRSLMGESSMQYH
jgi:hypothetical protein